MEGALVVAPVNFAVLLEQQAGVFLNVSLQFLQGGGTAASAKVFVNRIGSPERNFGVSLLVPQQVGAIGPPLGLQQAWGGLEIGPARRRDLDVQNDGPAGNDPYLPPAFEVKIPCERPLGEPVIMFAVIAVDRAVAVNHLPQFLQVGAGDLIGLVLAFHHWRRRNMRCRDQQKQNGKPKRNHHSQCYPQTAPRQVVTCPEMNQVTPMRMKKKRLKGNEKLREVYANAASALTVQFDDLKTKSKKPP